MTEQGAGLVVEFVGLPGSGKSTLSHAVAESLRPRHRVFEPTYRTDRLRSATGRRLSKTRAAFGRLVVEPGRSLSDVEAIRGAGGGSPAGWAAGALNWLYVAETVARASRTSGIHLLDQGVLQALWSVFYAQGRTGVEVRAWVHRAAMRVPPGTIAVILDAADDQLERRLHGRTGGRSRLEADIRVSPVAAEEALARARRALAGVQAVATELRIERSLELYRLDAGLPDPGSLVGRIAAILEDRIASRRDE